MDDEELTPEHLAEARRIARQKAQERKGLKGSNIISFPKIFKEAPDQTPIEPSPQKSVYPSWLQSFERHLPFLTLFGWGLLVVTCVIAIIVSLFFYDRNSYSITDSTVIQKVENVTINNNQPLRIFADLSFDEKAKIRIEAFVYFPEIFSMTNRDKYARFNEWLQKEKEVNHKNARDMFSAGGRKTITIGAQDFPGTPQILAHLHASLKDVIDYLRTIDRKTLQKYWGAVDIPNSLNDRFMLWAKLVRGNMRESEIAVFDAMIAQAQKSMLSQ